MSKQKGRIISSDISCDWTVRTNTKTQSTLVANKWNQPTSIHIDVGDERKSYLL